MSADDLFLHDDMGQLKAMIRTIAAKVARAEDLAREAEVSSTFFL